MNQDQLTGAASSPEFLADLAKGGAKASPGLAVTVLTYLYNMPVEKWVSGAVLVFTVLQIVVLVRREFLHKRRHK